MTRYVVGRLLQTIPLLLGVSILVFLLLHLAPGDPALALASLDASPEDIEVIRRQMGLDKSLPVQYAIWFGRVLRGDLGNSYLSGQPVLGLLMKKFPATLELTLGGFIVTLLISIPLAVLSAMKPGSIIDHLATAFNSLTLAVPTFWWGILLILLFVVKLGWFRASGRVSLIADPLHALRALTLPSLALGLAVSSVITRQTRSALLEVMNQDYIRTARAKGLRERTVMTRHVFKNASIPVVTILALYLGRLLSGAVVVEVIFAWPGIGRMILHGVTQRDYTVVQGTLLVTVTIIVFLNLLTDLFYAALDPRIRY